MSDDPVLLSSWFSLALDVECLDGLGWLLGLFVLVRIFHSVRLRSHDCKMPSSKRRYW